MRPPERIFPPYWIGAIKPGDKLRPFFGWIGRHANGPGNRTKRMTELFGNHYLNPNLVYAQSGWSIAQLNFTIPRATRRNVPVVLNQNGWYYPAWYRGDWQSANRHLLRAHQHSSCVIFQSRFCVEAMSALTGVVPDSPMVLHNAVHLPTIEPAARNPTRRTLWLSGVFHGDADHILFPALEAIDILAQEWRDDPPLLKIAGHFDKAAKKSEWFGRVQRKLDDLSKRRVCAWLGKYSSTELPGLMRDVSLALHLTSKDSCPNSVLERMALGVGHVYANSGGTPELVGDAGISISSTLDWSRQTPVAVDELLEAIKLGFDHWRNLGRKSYDRVKNTFSWDQYIAAHEKIFHAVARQEAGD
jgi:glycosyltransferase involved in cell wall biosynthesis